MKIISKILFTCLIICFSFTGYAQVDTCFTQQEILNITNNIKELQEKTELQAKLISHLKQQIIDFELLTKQDSSIIKLQEQEIGLLGNQIDLYKDMVKEVKPKWYERKFIWFILGAGTIVSSSWVVSNIK